MNAEELDKLIAILEAKDKAAEAFDGFTYGTLLEVAREAENALAAEAGVDSASGVMAEFTDKNG